jgi:hypothetical protein
MRVLKFFFSSFIILAILAATIGLIGREILLQWGLNTIKGSLSVMRRTASGGGSTLYVQQCQQKGVVVAPNESIVGAVQMRFTSDTEYVVEVICGSFVLDPIMVESKTLPMFVTKKIGNSGIIWGTGRSGIVLEVFGRSGAVGIENELTFTDSGSATSNLGTGPRSACAGYGFQCCQTETTVGQGEQLSGVTDCPRTCFSTCTARPVILSFTSQPFYDQATRTLTIKASDPVDFAYVASQGTTSLVTMTINFGDGQSEEFKTLNGSTSHTYACARANCDYQASIQAVDAEGIEAVATPLTMIKVKVTP